MNTNWIICVISTADISSLKDTESINNFISRIKQKAITLIFIVVGESSQKITSKFQKIFQSLEDTVYVSNPTQKQIRELIANISTVSLLKENLIFEKFRDGVSEDNAFNN